MELQLKNPRIYIIAGVLASSLVFNIVALGTMNWGRGELLRDGRPTGMNVTIGLWRGCVYNRTYTQCFQHSEPNGWEKAVGAMIILAMIMTVAGVTAAALTFVLILRTRLLLGVAALTQVAATVFSFVAVYLYAAHVSDLRRPNGMSAALVPGWSYALAVTHCSLALTGAIAAGVGFSDGGESVKAAE